MRVTSRGSATHHAHPDEIHAEELPHLADAFHVRALAGDVDAEHHRDRALASMDRRGIAPRGRRAAALRAVQAEFRARDTGWYGARTE